MARIYTSERIYNTNETVEKPNMDIHGKSLIIAGALRGNASIELEIPLRPHEVLHLKDQLVSFTL